MPPVASDASTVVAPTRAAAGAAAATAADPATVLESTSVAIFDILYGASCHVAAMAVPHDGVAAGLVALPSAAGHAATVVALVLVAVGG